MKKDHLDFLIDLHARPVALEMTVDDWVAAIPDATSYRGLPIFLGHRGTRVIAVDPIRNDEP